MSEAANRQDQCFREAHGEYNYGSDDMSEKLVLVSVLAMILLVGEMPTATVARSSAPGADQERMKMPDVSAEIQPHLDVLMGRLGATRFGDRCGRGAAQR